MRKNSELTQEDFENLLGRFSPNSEEAGEKYEQVHKGLIKFFHFRGCFDPENLADETINRVAVKLMEIVPDENFEIIGYFYSFAAKIFLEDIKKRKKFDHDGKNIEFLVDETEIAGSGNKADFECMRFCLAKFPAEERNLLIKYYSFGKVDKSDCRRILADESNMKIAQLQSKVSRLRKELKLCFEKCLKQKK